MLSFSREISGLQLTQFRRSILAGWPLPERIRVVNSNFWNFGSCFDGCGRTLSEPTTIPEYGIDAVIFHPSKALLFPPVSLRYRSILMFRERDLV